jgi:hypothetical protein
MDNLLSVVSKPTGATNVCRGQIAAAEANKTEIALERVDRGLAFCRWAAVRLAEIACRAYLEFDSKERSASVCADPRFPDRRRKTRPDLKENGNVVPDSEGARQAGRLPGHAR